MRSVQLLVLALLATGPCFQSLCLADTVEICNATASANGNTFSIPCNTYTPSSQASITISRGVLSIDLLDWALGHVSTSIPGAVVSFSIDWEASVSGEFEVTGGSGNGELVLTGGSDAGNFVVDLPGTGGVRLSGDFTSNFLPFPWPYPGYRAPIDVPFTFGVPFDLYADAILTGEGTSAGSGSSGFLNWEAILQWDLNSTEILDSNGNPVAGAGISSVSVPEPSTIAMALLMLVALAVQLRLRNTSARAQTKKL